MVVYICSRYGDNNEKIRQEWHEARDVEIDKEKVTITYEDICIDLGYSEFICMDIHYTDTKVKRIKGGQYE